MLISINFFFKIKSPKLKALFSFNTKMFIFLDISMYFELLLYKLKKELIEISIKMLIFWEFEARKIAFEDWQIKKCLKNQLFSWFGLEKSPI